MDAAEAHVKAYLEYIGFNDIIYEPDGNVPPDFLVDHRIAIEVRRLNQHESSGSRARGLEEVAIPLKQKLTKLLETFGPPNRDKTWFVFVRFQRPVENWKTLSPRITDWLQSFRETYQTGRRVDKDFGQGFSVTLAAASRAYPMLYLLGMFSDGDSGGLVLHELKRNLDICIEEKTKKISANRQKYPEWWLVLTDHIALGLDSYDREQFRDTISVVHDWDKIILLDPADAKHAFQI
jgi:hypothetical protein